LNNSLRVAVESKLEQFANLDTNRAENF